MQKPKIVEENLVLFYWTVGLNFSLFETMFMLRMLCGEEPPMWPSHLWPMLLFGVYAMANPNGYLSEFIHIYFFYTLFLYLRTMRTLINELCAVLNIFAFTIPS